MLCAFGSVWLTRDQDSHTRAYDVFMSATCAAGDQEKILGAPRDAAAAAWNVWRESSWKSSPNRLILCQLYHSHITQVYSYYPFGLVILPSLCFVVGERALQRVLQLVPHSREVYESFRRSWLYNFLDRSTLRHPERYLKGHVGIDAPPRHRHFYGRQPPLAMHFSKTYAELLQKLPPALRENAIEYRRLKKVIKQVVEELTSIGQ